jgi:hypothetical protein
MPDRDEALRDDFQLDSASYDYGDDDEWGEDDTTWATEDEPEEEEVSDARDESTAYLEFLHEEVLCLVILSLLLVGTIEICGLADERCRLKNSAPELTNSKTKRSLVKTAFCWTHPWTRSSHIGYSEIPLLVGWRPEGGKASSANS